LALFATPVHNLDPQSQNKGVKPPENAERIFFGRDEVTIMDETHYQFRDGFFFCKNGRLLPPRGLWASSWTGKSTAQPRFAGGLIPVLSGVEQLSLEFMFRVDLAGAEWHER